MLCTVLLEKGEGSRFSGSDDQARWFEIFSNLLEAMGWSKTSKHAGTRWCQYCIGIPCILYLKTTWKQISFEVLVVGGIRYLRRLPGVP